MNTNIGDYLKKLETTHGTALPKKSPKSRKPLKIVKKTFKWVRSHRTIAGGMALAMLLITVAPTAISIWQQRQYALSSEITKILSDVNPDLAKKLVYDEQTGAYIFNKENMPFDIPGSNSDEKASDQVAAIRLLQSKARLAETLKVGGSESKDEQLYSSSFAKDFSNGATYYDNQAGLSFTMIPEFKAMAGDMVGNRLVYPLKDVSGQAIYSVEASGVKEDVILHSFSTDKVVLSYKLQMSKTLEAKLLPSGGIGIYSADPSLFASNATSESADAEAVLKAQKTADKTHLVFAIPAPIVNDAQGQSKEARSHFELKNNTVDVVTTNLAKATFPLSIDPTIVVANSATLTSGNDESNTDITSERVQRAATTGGDVDAFGPTATLSETRAYLGTAQFNGYMYSVGGANNINGALDSVQYAQINSNGTLGSWTNTTSLPDERGWLEAVAYNGYLYAIGGRYSAGSTFFDTIYYAPLNSNGTVGSWNTTTPLTSTRFSFAAATYNGYMYVWGGSVTSAADAVTSVQYAAINADGTLGSWITTSSFTGERSLFGGIIYNGFIYVYGGLNAASVTVGTAQYAPINADGSVGTWITTTSLTSRRSFGTAVYAGYIYIIAGAAGGVSTTDAIYAQINANGSIAEWQTSVNQITNLRGGTQAEAANGYVYNIGGVTNTTTHYNDVQYAKITAAGSLDPGKMVTNTYSSTRERQAVTVYGGYVYMMGGYGAAGNNYFNYCQMAPLNADGNITNNGWTTVNCADGTNARSITTARADLATAAYNGYMYNFGGYSNATGTNAYYSLVQRATITASNGGLSTWTTDTALPTARAGMTAMAYNGYMYIVGGRDSTGTNLNTVLYSAINSSTGVLGAWNSAGTIPTASNRMRTVIANGYMYILGGTTIALPNPNNGASTGSRPTGAGSAVVSRAVINSNGTIGSMTATSSMIEARYEFAAVSYEGYMYAIGGFTASGVTSKIEVAQINDDGSLGTWRATRELNSIFSYVPGGSVAGGVYNGYIYILGGRNDSGITDPGRSTQARYIKINNGGTGSAGSFVTSPNNLTAAKAYAGSVYLNGYAYVIGGTATNNYNYALLKSDGSIDTWASGTLPTNVTGAAVTTANGYIYVMGGNSTNVYYAKPASNGSIASWSTATSLPAAIQYGSGVESNGYVYVLGGALSTTAQSTVFYAQINQDGSLGSWRTAGNALPAARYSGSAMVLNGTVYYVGGYNVSSQRTTYYASLNDEGSPGPWATSAELLPQARHGSVGLGVNGQLYIIGGNTSDAVYYTNIDINGNLSPWQNQRSFLPAARINASGVYANGFIYSFGGSSTTTNYYAPLNAIARTAQYSKMIDMGANTNIRAVTTAGLNTDGVSVRMRSAGSDGVFGQSVATSSGTYDGSTTDWAASPSLLTGSNGGGVVTYNGYMYVIRGGSSSTQYAKINADGTTGNWAYTTATPGVRQYAGVVTANGYIYVIGGQDGSTNATDTVYYAKFNSNGTVGTWSTGTPMLDLRRLMTTVVLNGYIYVIGGQDGSIIRDTTYYAKLNADGSVGAWNTTAVLPAARFSTAGTTYNGYIYVAAGFNSITNNDVYYAAVNANGTIASWASTTSLLVGTRSPSAVALNGYLYIMGGRTSSAAGTQLDVVQVGKLAGDGSVTSWSYSSKPLPQARSEAMTIAVNGYLYIISGLSTTTTSIITVHSTRMRTTLADTTNNTRYLWLTTTVDDNAVNGRYADVVFGQLKGLYIDYRIIAPPDSRLRGGKYFEGNLLQPLIRPESN